MSVCRQDPGWLQGSCPERVRRQHGEHLSQGGRASFLAWVLQPFPENWGPHAIRAEGLQEWTDAWGKGAVTLHIPFLYWGRPIADKSIYDDLLWANIDELIKMEPVWLGGWTEGEECFSSPHSNRNATSSNAIYIHWRWQRHHPCLPGSARPWERHSVHVHPPLSAPSWMGTKDASPLEHWAVVHSYVRPPSRIISTPPPQSHIFSWPHKKKEKKEERSSEFLQPYTETPNKVTHGGNL